MANCMIPLAVVAFAAFIQSGAAISCYQCISCGADPYSMPESDKVSSLSILGECKQCSKTYAGDVVSRACVPVSTVADGCTENSGGGVCFCSTDNCNGATAAVISLTTMLAALIAAKLF